MVSIVAVIAHATKYMKVPSKSGSFVSGIKPMIVFLKDALRSRYSFTRCIFLGVSTRKKENT